MEIKKFKQRDRVVHKEYGAGYIYEIDLECNPPILVAFDYKGPELHSGNRYHGPGQRCWYCREEDLEREHSGWVEQHVPTDYFYYNTSTHKMYFTPEEKKITMKLDKINKKNLDAGIKHVKEQLANDEQQEAARQYADYINRRDSINRKEKEYAEDINKAREKLSEDYEIFEKIERGKK